MRFNRVLTGIFTIFATAVFAIAQDPYDQPKPATEIPTEGFWPTQKMFDRIFDRVVDQMSEHYSLDDEQQALTGDLLKARYPEFMNENRAEIQTLLNQYFEAVLNDDPPAPEEVAEWAARVQPMLAEFSEVTHEITESMREYMNDDQIVMLDAETAAFDAGLTMAQNKLSVWAGGGYDPDTEWIHPPKDRHDPDDAFPTNAENDEDPEHPVDPDEQLPTDEWGVYTLKFIQHYELNGEQRQKAVSILRRQQEARDHYLKRKVEEMSRVTKILSEAQTDEERQAALAAYDRLNAPVDRIFKQLIERLDTLPTRAQRRAAADKEPLEPPLPDRDFSPAGPTARSPGEHEPAAAPAQPTASPINDQP